MPRKNFSRDELHLLASGKPLDFQNVTVWHPVTLIKDARIFSDSGWQGIYATADATKGSVRAGDRIMITPGHVRARETPDDTTEAHQSGFHAGVSRALYVADHPLAAHEDNATAATRKLPERYAGPHAAAWREGWEEGIEYVDSRSDDGDGEFFDGIGATDGVHYDQCVHWTRTP